MQLVGERERERERIGRREGKWLAMGERGDRETRKRRATSRTEFLLLAILCSDDAVRLAGGTEGQPRQVHGRHAELAQENGLKRGLVEGRNDSEAIEGVTNGISD